MGTWIRKAIAFLSAVVLLAFLRELATDAIFNQLNEEVEERWGSIVTFISWPVAVALAAIAVWWIFKLAQWDAVRNAGQLNVTQPKPQKGDDVRLVPSAPFRIEEGKEESTGTVKRGWGLIVWNDGKEEAQGVHANLEHIEFCDMESTLRAYWATNRDLHWAVREKNGLINIPSGQSARLQVIFYNETSRQVEFSYHGMSELFRFKNALSSPEPILILLNITSRGEIPTFAVCRIHPDSARSLIKHDLSGNPPLELLWSGTKRPQLSDFQNQPHQATSSS